ncbi:MAG: SMC-Scp complex subunit ScpB [Candidatus Doudnabacteria bacterium]|nr:SMC-Scp complex subunit ScpB [Candidatus Doudnabacteria bacterium]
MELAKLKSQILSILFVSSKPVSITDLENTLGTDANTIKEAIAGIVAENHNNGIILLAQNDKLQLATNPDNSLVIKKFLALELREKLSDPALETLAVVAYRQPVSKTEIENIRGVNSQYTIRQLLIRGLIEKIGSPDDRRVQHYRTTLEFMQHLGLKDMAELPDFEELTKNIQMPGEINTLIPNQTEENTEKS